MLSAIILAAGESSRMGRPKALLQWRGLPFIEHVCASLRASGVEDRVVVLGRASAEILAAWKPAGEKVTVNLRPEDGQLSSLRAGFETAGKNSEAYMVCLADQPTVSPETYKNINAFWRLHKDSIVIPRCKREQQVEGCRSQVTSRTGDPTLNPIPSTLSYKRGHPIIIPAVLLHLCFEGPLDKGLHWVTHHPSAKIADLDVEDREIIRDFDTPEDYEKLETRGLEG